MNETEPQNADTAPSAVRSTDWLEQLAATEDELMKAATDFGRMWGCDQTAHPKMYWLELHIERWRRLSAAAVKYSEVVDRCCSNDEASEPGTMTHDNQKPEAVNPRRSPGSLR